MTWDPVKDNPLSSLLGGPVERISKVPREGSEHEGSASIAYFRPPAPMCFHLGLYVDGWAEEHDDHGVFLSVGPFVPNST